VLINERSSNGVGADDGAALAAATAGALPSRSPPGLPRTKPDAGDAVTPGEAAANSLIFAGFGAFFRSPISATAPAKSTAAEMAKKVALRVTTSCVPAFALGCNGGDGAPRPRFD
jgi:hypothetical protein